MRLQSEINKMKKISQYIFLNFVLVLCIGTNLCFAQQAITLVEAIDISLKNNLDIQIDRKSVV